MTVAMASAPPADRWSDDRFLDLLSGHKDDLADATVARLIAENGVAQVGALFQQMSADDSQLPADAPGALRDFIEQTRELPQGIDTARLASRDALLPFGPVSCLVMLASSLPQGYSAPRLARILTISGDLGSHPYKRLMGVLQLLINLGNHDAFVPGGLAVVTAQKMRLLHAGIRLMVPRYRPDYQQQFGVPVNFEDQLATLMGFSYLVIDGLRRLGCVTRDKDAEDRYYRWQVFARLMGIHPPGAPHDGSWIPEDVAAAARFYSSYTRRHFTRAAENPEGARLAQINLDLMVDLVPKRLRRLGHGTMPRVAMAELLEPAELARIGMSPVAGHRFMKALFTVSIHLSYGLWRGLPRRLEYALGSLLYNSMVRQSRGGTVEFVIPTSVDTLRGKGFV